MCIAAQLTAPMKLLFEFNTHTHKHTDAIYISSESNKIPIFTLWWYLACVHYKLSRPTFTHRINCVNVVNGDITNRIQLGCRYDQLIAKCADCTMCMIPPLPSSYAIIRIWASFDHHHLVAFNQYETILTHFLHWIDRCSLITRHTQSIPSSK